MESDMIQAEIDARSSWQGLAKENRLTKAHDDEQSERRAAEALSPKGASPKEPQVFDLSADDSDDQVRRLFEELVLKHGGNIRSNTEFEKDIEQICRTIGKGHGEASCSSKHPVDSKEIASDAFVDCEENVTCGTGNMKRSVSFGSTRSSVFGDDTSPIFGDEFRPEQCPVHDFDFIFVFKNPGFLKEYEELLGSQKGDTETATTMGGISPGRRRWMLVKHHMHTKRLVSFPDAAKLNDFLGKFLDENNIENIDTTLARFAIDQAENPSARQAKNLEGVDLELASRARQRLTDFLKQRDKMTSDTLDEKRAEVEKEERAFQAQLFTRAQKLKDKQLESGEDIEAGRNGFLPCKQCQKKMDRTDGSVIRRISSATSTVARALSSTSLAQELCVKCKSQSAANLLKSFCVDPRQGKALQVADSGNINSLSEARLAVIDLFLSIFRRQDDDKYYTCMFKSKTFDEIFLCVKMSDETVLESAKKKGYPFTLSKDKIEKPVEEGGLGISYSPHYLRFFLNDTRKKISTWFHKGLPMNRSNDHLLDPRASDVAVTGGPVGYDEWVKPLLAEYPLEADQQATSIIRKSDNIRLLYDKVTDIVDLQDLVDWGLLRAFCPLHTKHALVSLHSNWARLGLGLTYKQPMHMIQAYFGEQITLYFVFMEFMLKYSFWLVLLAIILTVVELICLVREARTDKNDWYLNKFNVLGGNILNGKMHLRIIFSLCISVWSVVVRINLKRKIILYYNVWGVDTRPPLRMKAALNPLFEKHAEMTKSDMNDNDLRLGNEWEQRMRGRFWASFWTAAFTVFTTGCNVGFLWTQAWLWKSKNDGAAKAISLGLTVQIVMLNNLWCYLAYKLVEYEYWRWALDFQNSMAKKLFFVQFVNTFASFYYIAFFMRPLGDSSFEYYVSQMSNESGKELYYDGVSAYLTYQMLLTFGLYMVWAWIDLVMPFITLKIKHFRHQQELRLVAWNRTQASFLERQVHMMEYNQDLQNDDYMQILLPFGFVLFFGSMLPISVVLLWAYTSAQLRIDAWKLCHVMRRPLPVHARIDSWVWEDMIDAVMLCAQFTNIGLVSFVMDPMQREPVPLKMAVFFSLMSGSWALSYVLTYMFPRVPVIVNLARRRHVYQKEKVHKMRGESEAPPPVMNLRADHQINLKELCRLRKNNLEQLRNHHGPTRWRVSSIHEDPLPEAFIASYWECNVCKQVMTSGSGLFGNDRCSSCREPRPQISSEAAVISKEDRELHDSRLTPKSHTSSRRIRRASGVHDAMSVRGLLHSVDGYGGGEEI